MNRTRLAALVAVLALANAWTPSARAEEPPLVDPWPLPQAAPAQGAEAARSTLDALDARRSWLLRGRLAPMVEPIVLGQEPASREAQAGRIAVSPAQSMLGLKHAARTAQEADSRTVPEMMQVLAATAFDGGIVSPDVHVLPGPNGQIDRIQRSPLKPASIDDRPYVLRPSLLLRPSAVPPPPPPRVAPDPESSWLVKGVRIAIDEDLLRRAFAAPGAPAEGPALAALEARLLAAPDGATAARLLEEFARAQKQALFDARATRAAQALKRVSLATLLGTAGAARESAAHLGGLTRLVGVSLSAATGGPEGGDVTLLGTVEAGEPPLTLEDLCLALRYVWREGRVPGCSLDPDPKNPAGPQDVRIFGMAPDSAFALTMLEADYAMKQLVARAPGATRVPGLLDLPAAIEEQGVANVGTLSNRFWLTPAPPGSGDVLLAPGGAAALFDARVLVRSEEMREDFAIGTGRAAPAAARVARSLSERYEELARLVPVFARLRGLFDVVYAAQVLRFLAPRHPLLERAAERAHAPTHVPRTYPGLSVPHAMGGGVLVIEGGCEAATRLASGALLDAQHPAFEASGSVAVQLPVAQGRAPQVDELLLAAQAALAAGRPEEAVERTTEALDLAPDDLAALSLRGLARLRAGYLEGGLLDAWEASRRAPHEPHYEANLRALLAEAGDPQAFQGMSAPAREVLHATYMAEAGAAGIERDWARAATAAARAVAVEPASAEARVLRATVAWLVGDLAEARRLAEETAALLPRSADAHAVAGWVASMQGDFVAARSAFDRAIALAPAAETLGSRAVLRLLADDVAGAGADVYQALKLDAQDWGTQLAHQALRRAACLGLKRAQPELAAQVRLPPAAQLALYEAQQALTLEQPAAAVLAYERALAILDPASVPRDVLEASRAREMAQLMLARCLAMGAPGDAEAGARAASLLAEVESAHPTWRVQRWLRVTIAQQAGDVPAALAALASCRGGDPADDPILLQFVPPSRTCFAALVAVLEVSLPLMAAGGPGSLPTDPTAFTNLEAAYAGGPGAGTAATLAALLRALSEQADAATLKPHEERLAREAERIAARAPGPLPPELALLYSMVLGGHAADLTQAGGGDEALARVIQALATITLEPDIHESLTTIVAETRKRALLGAVERFVREVTQDPRDRMATRLAAEDPAAAARMAEEVVRPARDRAARLGEPLLEQFVDVALLGVVGGVEMAGIEARLARVRRVLEVALDPAKVQRLRQTESELMARKQALEAGLTLRSNERSAALRLRLATPTDARTQALLTKDAQAGAVRNGRAPVPPDPLDLARHAEIQLKASLQALRTPLPEGLK